MRLEEIRPGLRVMGLIPDEVVSAIAVRWHGTDAIELTYKTAAGELGQQNIFGTDAESLSIATDCGRSFDADARDFKLVAEAQRISLAGLFDPMLAVATSDVQPLPHQIRAVYGELLPRTPLRFLLADDPGAGKTIMAGLYIKELLLRDDVKRCLIVAPGGLVEQWQDELFFKFGLRFELLTNQLVDAQVDLNVFDTTPLLIARMDQLARNEQLQTQLGSTEWDLIVVDEAHRMGAHYYGADLRKTKRFQLGELLGTVTRHLLLMTATPHSGKEEDFQLFLTLLDRDRFEGKQKQPADLSGIMRRMVKEDLLTFEGKRLFPERIAETVPYVLTALEQDLYQAVTQYVRVGMNRADRLGGKRGNTVGFALTVLQRRLASSPEAIYKSLIRRSERLQRYRRELSGGTQSTETVNRDSVDPTGAGFGGADLPDADLSGADLDAIDDEEYSAEELERLEEELLDSATTAQTLAELEAELVELRSLIEAARQVCDSGTDRKWTELSNILNDHALAQGRDSRPRKLIIFTEHRETLNYLSRKIGSFLGRGNVVRAIHGGVRRGERRQITEEFTNNDDCQILLATDAAGEGLNLQAAHLMVNYDLPWNPNRIEQRFGRIHRIGQQEVCRLWNLVADQTLEGQVFTRLLEKLDQMRQTYGGKVFDVLGEAFTETPLRSLLLEAIQYGERPEVRARMHQIIDTAVGAGVKDLLEERALAAEHFADQELHELRAAMDEARARRLQPHYIELAFRTAFSRLGGRIAKREVGRYEITNVPQHIRAAADGPVATKYARVTFDLAHVQPDEAGPVGGSRAEPVRESGSVGRLSRADLLAPGHPLHDAVINEVVDRFGDVLDRGTVLISATAAEPQLLVGVTEEITDATGRSIDRRFGYAYVDRAGTVTPAGPAPYLDCVAAPGAVVADVDQVAGSLDWLAAAEDQARTWIINNQLQQYLAEVRGRRLPELSKVRALVVSRLEGERDRLLLEAAIAAEKQQQSDRQGSGRSNPLRPKPLRQSAESLSRKAADLDDRLQRRLRLLDRQQRISTKPPRIVTAALILPVGLIESSELESGRLEPGRVESGGREPGRVESGRPEPGRVESGGLESARLESEERDSSRPLGPEPTLGTRIHAPDGDDVSGHPVSIQVETNPVEVQTGPASAGQAPAAPTRAAQAHAKETKAVERRGVDLVLEAERRLGRQPVEQAFNNPGFDILSSDAAGDTYRIEVKARIAGAVDFWVTHNEVMTGKNAVPRYRLALVKVDPRGPQHDEVRYLDDPFARIEFGGFDATGHKGDWEKSWAKGSAPF